MKQIRPFHLAFPVVDLEKTRVFFQEVLGCKIGRTDERWIDFDFFGHQITAHLTPEKAGTVHHNPVDSKSVPIPHFGIILEWEQWHTLVERVQKHTVDFIIEPYIRFEGEPGEQATMFFIDPNGNALEFKSFKNDESIFATS